MKKILLLSFFIFSFSLSKAQWVTIPDPQFVNWLQTNYPTCMIGNMMDTTCSGIVNEDSLSIFWQSGSINNINGIEFFDSLVYFDAYYAEIDTINKLPPNLTYLEVHPGIGSLYFLPQLPLGLKILSCHGWGNPFGLNGLPSLPEGLIYLNCTDNNITALPVLPSSLKYLYCYDNYISSLPTLPTGLIELICNHNSLTTLPVLNDSLNILNCSENQLVSIPSLPNNLTILNCNNNLLNTIPALPSSLTQLWCWSYQLVALPPLPDSLNCLWIFENPTLDCLPELKKIVNFDFHSTGIQCLPNYGEITNSAPAINSFPLCDAVNPQSCPLYWNIKGSVYFDNNNDCDFQNGEPLIFPVKMKLYENGSLIQQIYYPGVYSFNTSYSNYTVKLDTTDIPFTVSCSTGIDSTVTVSPADSLIQIDFGLNCKPGFDIGVWNIFNWSNFITGNNASVHILAGDFVQSNYNISCSSGISGEVKVVINGPAHYVSPAIGALTPIVNNDTLTYIIPDFSLVNSDSDFVFNILVDSTANIGNQVCFNISVYPLMGDNNISNNILTECFSVNSSYDPNEKEVSPIGSLAYPFNDWLTYTIHFQNTGTAPAQNIQIFDTLDNDLKPSTFELLSFSKQPLVSITGRNIVFNFPAINLPDSSSDSEGSKGYVSYRIKPFPNKPVGIKFKNKASIYFDFNLPIETNTVTNIICNPITPTNISETICSNHPYNFNGTLIYVQGNYSSTFNAINGCDSVVNLSLTVLNPVSNSLTENICTGDIYNFNGADLNTTGVYSDTLIAINGCDSIVNLNLTVETINTAVTQANDTLSVSGNSIQWFDCNTQQNIPGATQPVFIPTTSGMYAAIITEGNCSDTTSCTQVFTGISELQNADYKFQIYPNPTDENVTVMLSQPCENGRIEITNTLGQIIFTQSINLQSVICNLQSMSKGIYFITLRSDKFSAVKKLVKQ